jgi:putative membrane protein
MIALFKSLHVAAISLWIAGLFALPFLFRQRVGLPPGDALDRLHRIARFLYVNLISRAAFVAIATGIVIIFLRQTWVPWFSLKLALVGALAIVHVLLGLVLLKLFEPGRSYSLGRLLLALGSTLAVVTAILYLVLGKPALFEEPWLAALFAPGALGELGRALIDRTR